MKTREKNQKKNDKKIYVAPNLEVHDVKVECGFAATTGSVERISEYEVQEW